MSKLVESTPGIDYQKVLDKLYEEFGNKTLDEIVLYWNTAHPDESRVTVEEVSDLI